MDKFFEFYSRREVQARILETAEDREVAPRYNQGFGRRPDVLQFPGDILEMAKKGATSFHISEERWENPLNLKPGMAKSALDENRKGWDLILDIDTSYWYGAKLTSYLLIEALKFQDVKNIYCKFSVTGDTPILIRKDKETRLLSIREVIKLLKKEEEIEVLSLNKENKVCFTKVYDFLAHKYEIYKLKHEHSKIPLKVTKHHSVFCWDKGLIVQKKVQELKKGDYLISFRKAEEIKRKIKDIKFEYKYNRKNVIKKIRITKEFVRLIGYYLSEGHSTTSINQVGFSFNINEKEYIEDCKKIIKEIFPNVNILDRHPNPNSHQIVIHSKEIYSLIRHLCKDKKEKKVPNFSWTLPRDYFLELLKGYARGDAHKKGEYHITIKSVALQMTTQFVWLCKLNNISCNLGFEKNKLHKLPQGNEFKGSYVHCIYIPKSEIYIDEFYRERNKFSPYPGDKLLPVDGLVEVYRQCKPGNFLSHRKEQMTLRKDRANLTRINNVINWIEDYKKEPLNLRSKTILEAYKKAIKGEITTIRIEEISFFKKGIVYDISVEDTERFFGNYYPLLLHNSGNKGFHIAIPFESFPDEVNGIVTKNLFPDALRVMAAYLQDMIHEMLVQKLMEKESVQSLCEKLGKKTEEVMKDGKFDPFTIIDIDTVLISNRHLFRSPYSMHEKSGLVSVPIDINRIMEFDKKEAEPENVKIYRPFLERNKGDTDAKGLIIQAFDWWGKNHAIQGSKGLIDDEIIKTFHELPKQAIAENYFPRCIEKILEGNMEDGKKRAIFILINFFKQMGWRFEDISERIKAWNKKNKQPLSESYIIGQLNWHRRQKENILPPNCSNDSYYRDLQIACEPHICDKNKNPVNCAKRAHRRAKEEEKKEAERLKKKTKKKAKQ